MFDIEYKGANAVVITTKKTKALIDPKTSVVGLKDVISAEDDVIIATETRFVPDKQVAKLLIDGPGEYEIGDMAVKGIAAKRHIDSESDRDLSTIYRVVIGDISIVVIGNIAPTLSDDQLESIGVVDMAILPVGGGGYTLDSTSATAIIRQLEPRMVVPVHFADSALKYEVPQQDIEVFINELGASVVEAGPKLKVKNLGSLPEQLTIVKISCS